MALFTTSSGFLLSCLAFFLFLSSPVAAFGAGNIGSLASIEGVNWRHGDIEDTLLNILMSRAAGGKKFSKLDVKRVYFGNWLRDYSQAVDVGTVKYVSSEAIRLLIWVLGFMSFGYATKEFEVTMDRLGCYRPEEHIDNPKDYADNLDARQYDRRLRGPVDERRELSINPQTGLKNYIATENMNIATSAGLVRDLFGRSIQLGRKYARSGNKADLFEAYRLIGTGCHCLEDYSAHSNYTELALIELGEREVFPHVGRQTRVHLPGARQPVYPIVTGTFGGVDFLHSVMGEFSDKATQSEIQELQGTMEYAQSSQGTTSILQDLLSRVPSGLFGGTDQASKVDELQMNAQAAQIQNTHITPRQPEVWAKQLQEVSKQIYPILEWHDEITQSITEFIEKIPILPDLIEQVQDQINIFVFSLLAPFILPVINQVKRELATGSSEIIQSSREKQLIVFRDDRSSDPTHSMLSKDHFSNILNEAAGKVASQVLKWVVPQLIGCFDNDRIDVERTLNRIINGVFHHPALRDHGDDGAVDGRRLMFAVMQQWWGQKDERERVIMRGQLSREGVEQGRNHVGGEDSGHGCGKPLGMPTNKSARNSGTIGGAGAGAILGSITSALAGESEYDASLASSGGRPSAGVSSPSFSKLAGEVVGGGAIGSVVGGLMGNIGGDLLGGTFEGQQKQGYQRQKYEADGSYTQSFTETGYSGPQQQRYGQAEYSQTNFAEGGKRQEYQRYEQDGQFGMTGFGEQIIRESRPTFGGGFEETTETRYERPGGNWESETRHEGRYSDGRVFEESKHHEGHGGYKDFSDSSSDDEHKKHKHKKKHHRHGSISGDEGQEYLYRAQSSGRDAEETSGNTMYYERQDYGEPNREYVQNYGAHPQNYDLGESRYEGRRPVYEEVRPAYDEGYPRYQETRPTYGTSGTPGGFQDEQNLEGRRYVGEIFESEAPSFSGYRGEQEFGEDEKFVEGRFEREEDIGEDGGYGQADEYQEQRGYGGEY